MFQCWSEYQHEYRPHPNQFHFGIAESGFDSLLNIKIILRIGLRHFLFSLFYSSSIWNGLVLFHFFSFRLRRRFIYFSSIDIRIGKIKAYHSNRQHFRMAIWKVSTPKSIYQNGRKIFTINRRRRVNLPASFYYMNQRWCCLIIISSRMSWLKILTNSTIAACITTKIAIRCRHIYSHWMAKNGRHCVRNCRQHSRREKWNSCFQPFWRWWTVSRYAWLPCWATATKLSRSVRCYLDSRRMWLGRAHLASNATVWMIPRPNSAKWVEQRSLNHDTV